MENIDSDVFDAVAKKRCKRWADESLKMLRLHFVDGQSISQIAKAHGKQQNTLSTMKSRFKQQIKKELTQAVDVKDFMMKVAPKKDLSIFRSEIEKLNNAHYTIEQISEFLVSNKLDVELDELKFFISELNSEANQ